MSNNLFRIKKLMLLGFLIFSFFFFALHSFAGDAKIDGKVSDTNGTGLIGVIITITPEQKDFPTLKTKTKKEGNYFFAFVKPGTYSISAVKEGFMLYEAEIIIRDEEKKVKETAKGRVPLDKAPPPIGVDSDELVTLNLTMKSKTEVDKELAGLKTQDVLKLLDESKYQEALDVIKDMLSKDPQNAAAFYLQGNAYHYIKDDKSAEESLKKAAELDPKQVGVHFLLGQIYYEAKKNHESIEEFKKELAIATENKDILGGTYLNLGIVYGDMNENDKAAEAFEKAIELMPKEVAAYNELAIIYTKMNKPEKAEEVMNRIKEMANQNPDIFYNLGVNYYNSKNFKKAAEEFQKALEIKPDYALAHKYLGFALFNCGDKDNTALHLKKYLELSPDSPDKNDIEQIINSLEKR